MNNSNGTKQLNNIAQNAQFKWNQNWNISNLDIPDQFVKAHKSDFLISVLVFLFLA
jgi:hypothetical protein